MFRSQDTQDDWVQGHAGGTTPARETAPEWAGVGLTVPPLTGCGSVVDLRGWLLRFAHSLHFYGGRYVQLARPCWGMEEGEPDTAIRHLSTSADAAREQREWIGSDPSIGRIRGTYAPFRWSTRVDAALTPRQRRWTDGERARGINAGLAIPVQDSAGCPAYVSLFGNDEESVDRLIERRAPELAFLAGQFHAIAQTIVPIADWVGRGPRLSNRELECLKLAALGQTVDGSGRTLGISGRTVEFHLRNALEKLGAPSKLRAVVLAFGAGVAFGA